MKSIGVFFLLIFSFTLANAKVFLSIEKQNKFPWKTCYTGSTTQAFSDVQEKKFLGGNDSTIVNLKQSGKTLNFELFFFGEKYRDVAMTACPFTDAEMTQTIQCEVTVQTGIKGQNFKVTDLGAYLPAIAKDWKKKGMPEPLIDCKKAKMKVVRNTWKQPVSIADAKVMKDIVYKYNQPLQASGMGTIWAGGSLHPYQDWSGELHLSFMEDFNPAEIYDASVEQFSAPGELQNWLAANNGNGPWTPWGAQFQAIKCQGFNIVDPTAFSELPLDLSAPSVKKFCSQK